MKIFHRHILVKTFFSIMGCDSGGSPGPPLTPLTIETHQDMVVFVGDSMSVILNRFSMVEKSSWPYQSPSGIDLRLSAINFSGLIISTQFDQVLASDGSLLLDDIDGVQLATSASGSSGTYILDGSVDGHEITNWPRDLFAPTHSDGSHKRYGDHMAWTAFEPKNPGSSEFRGVEGILIGLSVFFYDNPEENDVLFQRYDITNVGEDDLQDIRAGYLVDTDLTAWNGTDEFCGFRANTNQAGFDLQRDMAYSYMKPDPLDGNLPDECYGFASGVTFLDLSKGDISPGVYTNRIATRRPFLNYFPEFTMANVDTPERVRFALQGLDADGQPMMNPISGSETLYAFTGDPITGTGWLDARNDILQLIAKESFSLTRGETKSFVVAFIMAEGPDYISALTSLRQKKDVLDSQRELWDY